MKKPTKTLLLLITCALSLCAFAACDEESNHTHKWDADYTVDTPATCTADGSKSIHCSTCDEVKDVTVIDAIGHAWEED